MPVLATATAALPVLAAAAAAGPALDRVAETRALCACVSKKGSYLAVAVAPLGAPKAPAVTAREVPNARQHQGAQPGCPIENTPNMGECALDISNNT